MDKLKKFFTSIPGLILVFVLAAVPLVFGSIGSARAALTYYSDNYVSQVQMHDIGVSLIENNDYNASIDKEVVVSKRNYKNTTIDTADGTWDENTGKLIEGMFDENNKIKFGQSYREELSVKNTGNIDEYVRVTLYKYWVDKSGNKTNDLSPSLIDLHITPGDGWVEDESARTDERIVLYYTKIVAKNSDPTPAFTDTLTLSGDIQGNVKITVDNDGYTRTEYLYNDYQFIIRADVDAVQTHNAEAAIQSAWGKNVTISNGAITGGIQ